MALNTRLRKWSKKIHRNTRPELAHKCYVVVGLAISKPCVILGPREEGTFRTEKETMAGKTQTVILRMPNIKQIIGVPMVQRRAAKVERVACAFGGAVSISGLHLCMYSTDTLHPSPFILTKTYDL